MMYLFNNLAEIGAQQAILYGLFLVLCIFSYSMLMDQSRYAWPVELVKSVIGLALIWSTGDWFGLTHFSPMATYALAAYFLLSVGVVFYFNASGGGQKATSERVRTDSVTTI
jgi:uncharacterized membrane protein YjdF